MKWIYVIFVKEKKSLAGACLNRHCSFKTSLEICDRKILANDVKE